MKKHPMAGEEMKHTKLIVNTEYGEDLAPDYLQKALTEQNLRKSVVDWDDDTPKQMETLKKRLQRKKLDTQIKKIPLKKDKDIDESLPSSLKQRGKKELKEWSESAPAVYEPMSPGERHKKARIAAHAAGKNAAMLMGEKKKGGRIMLSHVETEIGIGKKYKHLANVIAEKKGPKETGQARGRVKYAIENPDIRENTNMDKKETVCDELLAKFIYDADVDDEKGEFIRLKKHLRKSGNYDNPARLAKVLDRIASDMDVDTTKETSKPKLSYHGGEYKKSDKGPWNRVTVHNPPKHLVNAVNKVESGKEDGSVVDMAVNKMIKQHPHMAHLGKLESVGVTHDKKKNKVHFHDVQRADGDIDEDTYIQRTAQFLIDMSIDMAKEKNEFLHPGVKTPKPTTKSINKPIGKMSPAELKSNLKHHKAMHDFHSAHADEHDYEGNKAPGLHHYDKAIAHGNRVAKIYGKLGQSNKAIQWGRKIQQHHTDAQTLSED